LDIASNSKKAGDDPAVYGDDFARTSGGGGFGDLSLRVL
jgi:hypothetical protein